MSFVTAPAPVNESDFNNGRKPVKNLSLSCSGVGPVGWGGGSGWEDVGVSWEA